MQNMEIKCGKYALGSDCWFVVTRFGNGYDIEWSGLPNEFGVTKESVENYITSALDVDYKFDESSNVRLILQKYE